MLDVVTLHSGRWFTIDPYLSGLENIKWDKKDLNLIWVTNSTPRYLETLKQMKSEIEHEYNSIRIFKSDLDTSENAFTENGPRTFEHAVVIAKLYNMAWDKCTSDKVLFLEDDINAPSNIITDLLPLIDDNTPYVTGVQFCRHQNIPFCWDLKEVPKGWVYKNQASIEAIRPRYMYGIQKIGCGHFGLTMLDKKHIDKVIKSPVFKPQYNKKGAEHFTGCDIVLCLELKDKGLDRLINWNVRSLHYDSNGVPH